MLLNDWHHHDDMKNIFLCKPPFLLTHKTFSSQVTCKNYSLAHKLNILVPKSKLKIWNMISFFKCEMLRRYACVIKLDSLTIVKIKNETLIIFAFWQFGIVECPLFRTIQTSSLRKKSRSQQVYIIKMFASFFLLSI